MKPVMGVGRDWNMEPRAWDNLIHRLHVLLNAFDVANVLPGAALLPVADRRAPIAQRLSLSAHLLALIFSRSKLGWYDASDLQFKEVALPIALDCLHYLTHLSLSFLMLRRQYVSRSLYFACQRPDSCLPFKSIA